MRQLLHALCFSMLILTAIVGTAIAGKATLGKQAETAEISTDPAVLRRGKIMFLQCRACHALDKDAEHKVGPNLHGVVGEKAAVKEGFNYSESLKAQNVVWDVEALDAFIESPTKYVPGTIMAFAGVSSSEDRKALIAYIASETK